MNLSFQPIRFLSLSLLAVSLLAPTPAAAVEGFTEPHVTLYGKVRQQDGGFASLKRSGEIELRLRREDQPENEITVRGSLREIGEFSYAIRVPLKYLPAEYQREDFLSVDSGEKSFQLVEVRINNEVATLEDGSREFLPLSMADRGAELRLDLAFSSPFTDRDNDGLADDWEDRFNLVVGVSDQNTDLDLDGWSALEEFLAGTDPTVDNRPATLSEGETEVPEQGLAGLYLDIIDSNTPADEIQVTLDASALSGVGELLFNGVVVNLTEPLSVTAADVREGRLAVRQLVAWSDGLPLGVTLQDPDRDEAVLGNVELVTGYLVEPGQLDASLWLDAAALSGGGALATWPDRSGHNQAVMQANPAYQPSIGTHTNGLATVDFSETQAHLFLPSDLFSASQQTILMSADFGSIRGKKSERVLWSTADSGARLEPRLASSSHPDALRFRHGGSEVYSWAARGGNLFTLKTSGSDLEVQSQWDASTSESEVAGTEPVFPCLGLARKLSGNFSEAAATSFDGALHELLVFPRELAEQELRRKQNLLTSKWSGAEVWDFGTQVRPLRLGALGVSSSARLIRGGWGHDQLGGTPNADVLSGGSGDDVMTGGAGRDTFLFGQLDIGSDVVTDFDPAQDVLNFSKLFAGQGGNALDVLTLGYDYGFEDAEPIVDTVITVARADGELLSVTLPKQFLSEDDLAQWIVEGAINMGALSVPQALSLSAQGLTSLVEGESGVQLVLTRSGRGSAGRIEVPVSLLKDSRDSREFVIPSALQPLGDRATVVMERGETEVIFELQAINDGLPEGDESWQISPVQSDRWDVVGNPVELAVSEVGATFSLSAENTSLSADRNEPVTIMIERLDDGQESLTLDLLVRSNQPTTAWSGLPSQVVFAPGEVRKSLTVSPGEITARGVLLVSLQGQDGVQVITPSEVRIRLLPDSESAPGTLFDEVVAGKDETGTDAMLRHIYGAGDSLGVVRSMGGDLMLKVEGGHSVLMPRMNPDAADVLWRFSRSGNLAAWDDASQEFSSGPFDSLTGRGRFVSNEATVSQGMMFYRSQAEILAPVANVLTTAWTDDGLEMSGVARSGSAAGRWKSQPDGGLFLEGDAGAGSLILNFEGDGEVRFMTGLTADASGSIEVWVDGSMSHEFAAGQSGEVILDVVPGVYGTVELRSQGGGVFVNELNFIPEGQ